MSPSRFGSTCFTNFAALDLSAAEYREQSTQKLHCPRIFYCVSKIKYEYFYCLLNNKKKMRKNASIPLRMRSLSQHPRRSGSNPSNISFDLSYRAQRNTVNTRMFYCLLNTIKNKTRKNVSILAEAVPIS